MKSCQNKMCIKNSEQVISGCLLDYTNKYNKLESCDLYLSEKLKTIKELVNYKKECEEFESTKSKILNRINTLICACGMTLGNSYKDGIRFACNEIKKEIKK